MATTFKSTALTDRSASTGGGQTTELNSVANAGYSAGPGAYDNTANLDAWAECELVLASLTPTTGAYVQLYLAQSLDGTNFEDAPSASNPAYHMVVSSATVTTGAGAKRIMFPAFRIPAGKFKLYVLNKTGVAFASSANTLKMFTFNEQGV